MSREVEVLLEFGCEILLVIVFMGLIYMIASRSCETEVNSQLEDELENKSIVELRRQRQNLANRFGGNIDLPSPAITPRNMLHVPTTGYHNWRRNHGGPLSSTAGHSDSTYSRIRLLTDAVES